MLLLPFPGQKLHPQPHAPQLLINTGRFNQSNFAAGSVRNEACHTKPTGTISRRPGMGWKYHPTLLVPPDPGTLLDALASVGAAATILLIDNYTASLMACMPCEIIFGGLNIDSPSLNSKWS